MPDHPSSENHQSGSDSDTSYKSARTSHDTTWSSGSRWTTSEIRTRTSRESRTHPQPNPMQSRAAAQPNRTQRPGQVSSADKRESVINSASLGLQSAGIALNNAKLPKAGNPVYGAGVVLSGFGAAQEVVSELRSPTPDHRHTLTNSLKIAGAAGYGAGAGLGYISPKTGNILQITGSGLQSLGNLGRAWEDHHEQHADNGQPRVTSAGPRSADLQGDEPILPMHHSTNSSSTPAALPLPSPNSKMKTSRRK